MVHVFQAVIIPCKIKQCGSFICHKDPFHGIKLPSFYFTPVMWNKLVFVWLFVWVWVCLCESCLVVASVWLTVGLEEIVFLRMRQTNRSVKQTFFLIFFFLQRKGFIRGVSLVTVSFQRVKALRPGVNGFKLQTRMWLYQPPELMVKERLSEDNNLKKKKITCQINYVTSTD